MKVVSEISSELRKQALMPPSVTAESEPHDTPPLQLIGLQRLFDYLRDKDAAWMEQAACAQIPTPDIFFPGKGGNVLLAKFVCSLCPVMDECLEYVLATNEAARGQQVGADELAADDLQVVWHGVWGGLSERERRVVERLLRKDEVVIAQDYIDDTRDRGFTQAWQRYRALEGGFVVNAPEPDDL